MSHWQSKSCTVWLSNHMSGGAKTLCSVPLQPHPRQGRGSDSGADGEHLQNSSIPGRAYIFFENLNPVENWDRRLETGIEISSRFLTVQPGSQVPHPHKRGQPRGITYQWRIGMKNVEIQQDGDKLVITIDTKETFGRSRSGKTVIIATSEGNQTVETPNGTIFLGINVYKK